MKDLNKGLELLQKQGLEAHRHGDSIVIEVGLVDKDTYRRLIGKGAPIKNGDLTDDGKGRAKPTVTGGSAGRKATMPKELFMPWDDLDKAGKLEAIKAQDYDLYCVLFKNKFGRYPKDLQEKCPGNKWVEYQRALDEVKGKGNKNLSDDTGDIDYNGDLDKEVDMKAIPPELFVDWDVLDKGNKLEKIKETNYTLWYALFVEHFGKGPTNVESKRIDPTLLRTYQEAIDKYWMDKAEKMTWDELVENDLTTWLRNKDWKRYSELYEKKFGKKPRY